MFHFTLKKTADDLMMSYNTSKGSSGAKIPNGIPVPKVVNNISSMSTSSSPEFDVVDGITSLTNGAIPTSINLSDADELDGRRRKRKSSKSNLKQPVVSKTEKAVQVNPDVKQTINEPTIPKKLFASEVAEPKLKYDGSKENVENVINAEPAGAPVHNEDKDSLPSIESLHAAPQLSMEELMERPHNFRNMLNYFYLRLDKTLNDVVITVYEGA